MVLCVEIEDVQWHAIIKVEPEPNLRLRAAVSFDWAGSRQWEQKWILRGGLDLVSE